MFTGECMYAHTGTYGHNDLINHIDFSHKDSNDTFSVPWTSSMKLWPHTLAFHLGT